MVTARSSKRHQKAAAIGQKRVAKVKEEEPTSEYEWFDEPSKDEEDEEYQDEDEKEGDEDEDEDEDSDDDETEDLGEVKERPPKPQVMKKKIKVLYQEMEDGKLPIPKSNPCDIHADIHTGTIRRMYIYLLHSPMLISRSSESALPT